MNFEQAFTLGAILFCMAAISIASVLVLHQYKKDRRVMA